MTCLRKAGWGIVCVLMMAAVAGGPARCADAVAGAPLVAKDTDAGNPAIFFADLAEDIKSNEGGPVQLTTVDLRSYRMMTTVMTAPLAPGRYRVLADWAAHPLGTIATGGLRCIMAGGGGEKVFSALHFDADDAFRTASFDFSTDATGEVPIHFAWAYVAGKDAMVNRASMLSKGSKAHPAAAMAAKKDTEDDDELGAIDLEAGDVSIETVREVPNRLIVRNVRVVRLLPVTAEVRTDRIVYKPGEPAKAVVTLRNWAAAPQTVACSITLEGAPGVSQALLQKPLTLGPGATETLTLDVPTAAEWGHAVTARLTADGFPEHRARAVFGVADNFWKTAIVTSYSKIHDMHAPNAQTPEEAAARVDEAVRRGFTVFEAFFWAPCDMIEYTPERERFYGCQGAYPGTISGTKATISAAHARGMASTFYANLWGAAATPGMEVMRKHPEWFGEPNFTGEFVSDWELLDRGINRGPTGVWFYVQANPDKGAGLFELHAKEIIGSVRQFGWDGTRYDSYYSADWTKKATAQVRAIVEKEIPTHRWGYNSLVPGDIRAGAIDIMVSGGHLIMEEGLFSHMSKGGGVLKTLVDTMSRYRDELARHGGYLGICFNTGENGPTAADVTYASAAVLAGGGHPYYNPMDTMSGDFPAFALRNSGLIWDIRLLPMEKATERVQPAGAERFCLWPQLVREADLGGGRKRIVFHLINAPENQKMFSDPAMVVAAPARDVGVTVQLPAGATVDGAWALSPCAETECVPLKPGVNGAAVTLTVPEVRVWCMGVVDYHMGAQ